MKSLWHLVPLILTVLPGRPAMAQAPQDEELRKLATLLDWLRARNARDYAITTPNGIDEARYVEIGGLQQWITIRGEDRANPVLLFLHGGPGEATNPWGHVAFRTWLREYTVVQWDQRGAGRTLSRNGDSSAATITLERMTRDGIELAELLRTTLGRDKILLVGHSWGSILGVLMAKARPDLFLAFVGTGQVGGDGQRNYSAAFDALVEKARRVRNDAALAELEEVGPPPYRDGRGYAVQRKWSSRFEGADRFLPAMMGVALTAPGYTIADVNDWAQGQMLSAERLVPLTAALDVAAAARELALPVFVVQGAEDFTTPTGVARELVAGLRAPRKEFVALEGGGHFAVFMQPEAFLGALRALVRQVMPMRPSK